MRFIRLLAALLIVYGFSYLMYGLMQHFNLFGYQADRWVITLNLNIGVFTLYVGIGMLWAKEWARVACLTIVTMLLTLHVFLLALMFLTGGDLTLQITNVILTSLIFLISWSKLTRASVKELFR